MVFSYTEQCQDAHRLPDLFALQCNAHTGGVPWGSSSQNGGPVCDSSQACLPASPVIWKSKSHHDGASALLIPASLTILEGILLFLLKSSTDTMAFVRKLLINSLLLVTWLSLTLCFKLNLSSIVLSDKVLLSYLRG